MEFVLMLIMYILGVFWIGIGALSLFAPELAKEKFFKKFESVSPQKCSLFPLLFGIILLFAGSYNRYTGFIRLLGIASIVKGLLCLFFPERISRLALKWINSNTNVYRALGIVLIVLGSFVLIGI